MRRPMFRLKGFILLALVVMIVLPAGVIIAQGGGQTIASGFNSPQGIYVADDGAIWVADSGIATGDTMPIKGDNPVGLGDNARVVKIAPDGTQTVEATLPTIQWPSPQDNTGAARVAILNGQVYATSSMWNEKFDSARRTNMAAIVRVGGGNATEVANTWDVEENQNPAGGEMDTHPYGIIAGDNVLYVADAGGNDLLKVNPSNGQVDVVAVFPPVTNTAGFGPPVSEAVPTAVLMNDDGSFLVSNLPGFPFGQGDSKVVKVASNGALSDYATGLTMTTDLRRGPDGEVYAIQFAVFGQQGPTPNTGALVRVKEGNTHEVILSGLSFPTSVDFDGDGNAYITINGVGAPGSGAVVKYSDIAPPPPPPPAEIPEPATIAMLGAGLAGLVAYARRRRQQA